MLRLKELRAKKGLSQSAFAKAFGVAQNTVSNWENGNRTLDAETASRIANYFHVTVDYLLGRTDEPRQLSLDEQLEGIEFALYGEVKDLTDEEKQDILTYIRFKKQQDQLKRSGQ